MRIYSKEELEGKLQAFPDVYESTMGEPLDLQALVGFLTEQLEIKKKQFIQQAFSELSVNSIKTLLNSIKEQKEKPIEQPKKAKKNVRSKDLL